MSRREWGWGRVRGGDGVEGADLTKDFYPQTKNVNV